MTELNHDKSSWEPAAIGIYEQLKNEILEGTLAPDTIVSELSLAKRFDISHAPLREAIWKLEKNRLIVRAARQLARIVSYTNKQYIMIAQMREAIEGMSERLAATCITEKQLSKLYHIIDQQQNQLERNRKKIFESRYRF